MADDDQKFDLADAFDREAYAADQDAASGTPSEYTAQSSSFYESSSEPPIE